MWGSQGWNQWALQPSMFNDVPHEQIDWAELAKQWIQMQQSPSDGAQPHVPPPVSIPLPPGLGPHIPDENNELNINPPPPLLKTPTAADHVPELFHSDRPFAPEANFIPKSGETNFWNKPQWSGSNDVDHRIWNEPPVEPVAPVLAGSKETFDYGHVHDNPPIAMQTIDYNHMSDYPYNQVYTPPVPPPPIPESQYDQYWSQVNAAPSMPPIFLKKERQITSTAPSDEESSQIDAAKRKQLPAWIRDGLEKMEQERLKRLEKERSAKEHAERLAKQKDSSMNLQSSSFIPKSKFDSDSDDEPIQEAPVKRNSPIMKRLPPPVDDTRSEEEKKQDLMLTVRHTLTEVLLSVTNSEMIAIAQEVLKKAKSKAPARQLAPSTSLTTVASGLRGLASYDTGSDASDAEERNDSSDSEEELYRKIKEKKRNFAAKEKKIIADLERKELEDKTDREKMNNGNSEKNSKENIIIKNEEMQKELNSDIKLSPVMLFNRSSNSNVIPFISEKSLNELVEDSKAIEAGVKIEQKQGSNSSIGSTNSSDSESGSSEKNRKKRYSIKDKNNKTEKRERSPSKEDRHHKRKSRDSDSSDKHKRSRSSERKSSSKKKKKSKRSESSSSSSTVSHRRKSSKKHSSNHRDRRSHSHEERRHRHSDSRHRSDSHKSSHNHKYRDDKYERRSREEKKSKSTRRSSSPHSRSSKIPRKYRESRSLSSESDIYGKKSKKSRNH